MRSFCETKNSWDLRLFFQDFTGAHPIFSSFFSNGWQNEGDSLNPRAKPPRREPCSTDAFDPYGTEELGRAAERTVPGP